MYRELREVFNDGRERRILVRCDKGKGNADKTINHTGVIRVEGVNNQNEMTSVVDIIINQLRGEVRI